MFWESGYSNSVSIEALLNKESCTLKELLEDEDILQECKSQNPKLVKFLNRTEIVDELITLISTEPSTEYAEEVRFLHPNMACEIITSDVPSLKQRMVEDPNIMNKLYNFFEQDPPLNPLLASFICRTFSTLLRKMDQDWFLYQTICLHVLEFIKSKDKFLDVMIQHFATPVVVDLMLNMLNDIEDAKMKSSFLEWINERGLIAKMIDVLQVPDEASKHGSIAQFLTDVIKIGRCNRQNDTEDRKGLPNPLLQTLEDDKTVDHLLDVILGEPQTESGILSGIQVLLCLLENPIIQEPVSQSALQQMIDAEKEHHDEIVASLMGIVQPRVHQLFELLLNPPIKHPLRDATSDHPLTAPLGNVRLQLCYLFTVLLETENTSIIEEICKTDFFVELLKLFKQYCWNNFLHNYVKKCLGYGIQAFDTIPKSTQLLISALQKHIVVDCKLADNLIDCWNENSRSQMSGGRRMGYMGHLIDIFGAVQSSLSASDEFRALIESSLSTQNGGEGEPAKESSSVEAWQGILQLSEDELKTQSRFLADCDPNERQDYGIAGLTGFPSTPAEYENDAEEFDYQFNSSLHGSVNGMGEFSEDFTNEEDLDARNKMFEEACNSNVSAFSMGSNFADWSNSDATSANHDFPFDFHNSLTLKSTSPFLNEADERENIDDDPFASANGFNSIIDNFADFDSHFADMTTTGDKTPSNVDEESEDQVEHATETCFVATTQTVEISTAPPEPMKREFLLGSAVVGDFKPFTDELEDDEFFSLRDDSNDMNSLTDDNDKKFLENTEVPEDEDDDFASADESKGNSEEETNSNGGDQFVDCTMSPPLDAKNDDSSLNGDEFAETASPSEPNDNVVDKPIEQYDRSTTTQPSTLIEKLAQAPESELITPVVPLENGTA